MPNHFDEQAASSSLRYFHFIGKFVNDSHSPARSFFDGDGIYCEIEIDVPRLAGALISDLGPELAGVPRKSQFDLPVWVGLISVEKGVGEGLGDADGKAKFFFPFQSNFFDDFGNYGIKPRELFYG
ncbi:MAG: hypothetical protein WBP29_02980 [Candidatus Zixiibacteriota bacterium]